MTSSVVMTTDPQPAAIGRPRRRRPGGDVDRADQAVPRRPDRREQHRSRGAGRFGVRLPRARTAPARPPRSGCCSAWSGPPPAATRCSAAGFRRTRSGCCRGSGRWSRDRRSTRTCPAGTTCAGWTRPTAPPTRRPAPSGSPRALDRVGLTAAAAKRYRNYSLGMRQRLGIAAALLQPRELLILDEPTNGLDPQGTREVRSLVSDLAATGVTVHAVHPPALRGRTDLHARRRHAHRQAGRAVPADRSAGPDGAAGPGGDRPTRRRRGQPGPDRADRHRTRARSGDRPARLRGTDRRSSPR